MTTTERKLIEKQKELIEWLNQECPSVAPPLEPYTIYDLTHTFCESLRFRLDEIASLESKLAKEQMKEDLPDWDNYKAPQEPEGVTAEEILNKWCQFETHIDDGDFLYQNQRIRVLKAMESYAESKQINLRDELIKFRDIAEITIGVIITDKYIDGYLKHLKDK
jgi:hypothetical protein